MRTCHQPAAPSQEGNEKNTLPDLPLPPSSLLVLYFGWIQGEEEGQGIPDMQSTLLSFSENRPRQEKVENGSGGQVGDF